MDRLSIILTLMTGAVLTGGMAIVAFSLGFYSWTAVGIAAVLGFVLSWPVAYLVSRRIKRVDAEWDTSAAKDTGVLPKPGAPEV